MTAHGHFERPAVLNCALMWPLTYLDTGKPRADSSLGLTATGWRASSSGSAAAR
jgi:hypothetical protein